nr:MAG TPA_asm: hypothetical protein [Caudoviricetes sp.]
MRKSFVIIQPPSGGFFECVKSSSSLRFCYSWVGCDHFYQRG